MSYPEPLTLQTMADTCFWLVLSVKPSYQGGGDLSILESSGPFWNTQIFLLGYLGMSGAALSAHGTVRTAFQGMLTLTLGRAEPN